MRTLTIVLISLLLAASAFADKKVSPIPTADIAPDKGPVAQSPPTDDMWDLLFYTDLTQSIGDYQCLGGEYAVEYFYITAQGIPPDSGKVFIFSSSGGLVRWFYQWGGGWRDLAYDYTYLYAAGDSIYAFDLMGNPVPEMNIAGPISVCRALAYDEVTDHFWTQSFSGPLVEFDREGNAVWSGSSGATAYGAAYDNAAPDGPWLWIFSQSGMPMTSFHQFDPVNHVPTGFIYQLPLLPGSTDQIAGGAFFTEEWDPDYWVLGGITQGIPDDMLFCLEMYPAANPYAPTACENFTAEADPGGALTCDLTWDLPTMTINGQPISSYPITSVELERDGTPLVSLGPAATSYTDNLSSADFYIYRVNAVNDSGNGLPVSDTTWVGLDVPGGVQNLVGAGIGTLLVAELSWDNPTTGAHSGYFPPGSIDGYTIHRYGANPATFNLPGIQTGFIDNTVPEQGWCEYSVIAYNASGPGPEVNSNLFYVGPVWFEEIPYDWVEINPAHPGALPGSNTGINGDDQNLGPFPIGFTFPFWEGTYYNIIRVCSNGFASFTSVATTYTNDPIPEPDEPNNLVAPYWDDLNPSSTGFGSVWYYHDAANQRFIVEWDSCDHYGSYTGDYFTFELILRPDASMDFMYKAIVPGNLSPFPSASVGNENATGTHGLEATYNGSGPIEPQSEMGIGFYGYPWWFPVEIALTPYNPPITIPATGGRFDFNIALTNNEPDPLTFEVWVMVDVPGLGWYGPVLGPVTLTLPAGQTIDRDRVQNVPAGAPAGTYTYEGRAGMYPGTIWDDDSFTFDKLATGQSDIVSGWANIGDSFDLWRVEPEMKVVSDVILDNVYPNPFNQTTTVRFSLPEVANVTLTVYDINGRRVADLVDGWHQAGVQETVFDATNLASGVYICRLTSGSVTMSNKMVLMK